MMYISNSFFVPTKRVTVCVTLRSTRVDYDATAHVRNQTIGGMMGLSKASFN